MRITQLEYFVKVAECGSITKAAQELFISQPTLTKAIANLENEYEIKLLERTAKGVYITERGQEFLEYAEEVIESRRVLDDTFRRKKGAGIQRFSIASSQFDFLYPILEQVFQENDMHVNAIVAEVDRGSVLNYVAERKANLGLLTMMDMDRRIFESEIKNASLSVEEITDSGAWVAMAPSSPLYEKQVVMLKETSSQLQVGLDVDERMIRKTRLGEMTKSYDGQQIIFCNTISIALYFVRGFGAITYLPRWVLGLVEKEPDIRLAPLLIDEKTPYPSQSHLAWVKRRGENLSFLEQRFVHLLKEKFSE